MGQEAFPSDHVTEDIMCCSIYALPDSVFPFRPHGVLFCSEEELIMPLINGAARSASGALQRQASGGGGDGFTYTPRVIVT